MDTIGVIVLYLGSVLGLHVMQSLRDFSKILEIFILK